MKVLANLHEVYAPLDFARCSGKRIGLVPTMGALHEGHLSLVRRAKSENDVCVATIFVNPSQFGPNEDFQRYPRTLDADCALLEQAGCDLVFTPSTDTIYPEGFSTYVNPPAVATRWEGECRPGHFRGVATIVLKLFQLLPAHVAYFGRKDYQQVAVIAAMVRDLGVPIRIEACETVREPDGLAMSSRNRYLSNTERQRSLALHRALSAIQNQLDAGQRNTESLTAIMRKELESGPVDSIDYAVIVDCDSLEPISTIHDRAVALIAARLGNTRLIDNRILIRSS